MTTRTAEARRTARLSAWTTAVLRDRCPVERAVDAIVGEDALHEVVGLPGYEDQPVPLARSLRMWQDLGVSGLRYAPAAPGDVSSLPGPPEFNAAALASGAAALTVDGPPLGLLPRVMVHGPVGDQVASVAWQCRPVESRVVPPVDLRAAERLLVEALQQAVDELHRLDVVRFRPEAQQLRADWRQDESPAAALPPAFPPAAAGLLERAVRLRQVVALAGADEGGAVTADEAVRRQQVLARLESVARHSESAAWNALLVPGG